MTTKGVPPDEKPVGMTGILCIGEYKSPANALHWGTPDAGKIANLKRQGHTHYAVYAFPHGYKDPCVLQLQAPL